MLALVGPVVARRAPLVVRHWTSVRQSVLNPCSYWGGLKEHPRTVYGHANMELSRPPRALPTGERRRQIRVSGVAADVWTSYPPSG